eukprot:gene6844-8175_t
MAESASFHCGQNDIVDVVMGLMFWKELETKPTQIYYNVMFVLENDVCEHSINFYFGRTPSGVMMFSVKMEQNYFIHAPFENVLALSVTQPGCGPATHDDDDYRRRLAEETACVNFLLIGAMEFHNARGHVVQCVKRYDLQTTRVRDTRFWTALAHATPESQAANEPPRRRSKRDAKSRGRAPRNFYLFSREK